jgi:hypothetical protein
MLLGTEYMAMRIAKGLGSSPAKSRFYKERFMDVMDTQVLEHDSEFQDRLGAGTCPICGLVLNKECEVVPGPQKGKYVRVCKDRHLFKKK